MSPDETRGPAPASFDPEAEQEVDFGRYWRLLAARWWLLAAGVVVGAILGYAVSLGSSQTFEATATIYLGQPYTASGNVQLQSAQTNPSTVRAVIHSESVIHAVAAQCKAKPADFRGGISTQSIAGNIVKNGQTAEVSVTVQSARRLVAACAANGLAKAVIAKTSAFANQKIANFRAEIAIDEKQIALINTALQRGGLSASDQLLLQLRLATAQQDRLSTSQLLLQATQVEAPSILTGATAQRVSARSRRNSVVVAALIGLILGAIGALMWDGVAAGLSRRRTA
ncbi:MAG TPA: Wzz/FepE/Etk N-terminal domain-containing protein [Gaiellaceae bacterium]|nr:Wzz/FepE/Etk N-terminal domain-containing protein [Gaiellaceae bacterium]